jgi:hypothetical protein
VLKPSPKKVAMSIVVLKLPDDKIFAENHPLYYSSSSGLFSHPSAETVYNTLIHAGQVPLEISASFAICDHCILIEHFATMDEERMEALADEIECANRFSTNNFGNSAKEINTIINTREVLCLTIGLATTILLHSTSISMG